MKLEKFPLCDIFKYKIFYRFFKGIKVIQPLNEIEFNKEKVLSYFKKNMVGLNMSINIMSQDSPNFMKVSGC